MKNKIATLTLLGLSVSASPAFAADTWSADVSVDQIEGNASISAYFVGSVPNPAGCSQVVSSASWDQSDPAARNFMAMLLNAKVAGRPVQVLVDGTNCLWGGWPKLLSVKLK